MKASEILKEVLEKSKTAPDVFDLLTALITISIKEPVTEAVRALCILREMLPIAISFAAEQAEREERNETVLNW